MALTLLLTVNGNRSCIYLEYFRHNKNNFIVLYLMSDLKKKNKLENNFKY